MLWKEWSGYLKAWVMALGARPDVELLASSTAPDTVAARSKGRSPAGSALGQRYRTNL